MSSWTSDEADAFEAAQTVQPLSARAMGQVRPAPYLDGLNPAQRAAVEASKLAYGRVLSQNGYGPITSEIADAGPFYFAEDYHQQYLAKNPMGYCGLGGTGVACQIGVGVQA